MTYCWKKQSYKTTTLRATSTPSTVTLWRKK
nr:MAG TPA: hypothetical protein [Caudoviricetes sp.]